MSPLVQSVATQLVCATLKVTCPTAPLKPLSVATSVISPVAYGRGQKYGPLCSRSAHVSNGYLSLRPAPWDLAFGVKRILAKSSG